MTELGNYDYELPRELIAQQPLAHRADARLMVVDRGASTIEHRYVRDLAQILQPGDCLVLNDTRVVPARLVGRRTMTGGHWEGLFLAADQGNIWKLLAKTRGKIGPGETVTLVDRADRDDLTLTLIERLEGGQWLARADSRDTPMEILDRLGRVPLPHYIRGGEMLDSDRQRYQTVFARHDGSVAAPTAGLHFTDELLQQCENGGIQRAYITLHVALDTFRPISSETIEQHKMHSEWGRIDAATAGQLNECRAAGGRVIAVGTTSVRVLESCMTDAGFSAWSGQTDLFIRPPYEFRAVDALMTNFHLPRTTLFVLVCCFGGGTLIRSAYADAMETEYRFFSYGDAMLIL